MVFHGIAIVRAPTRVPALRPPPQISAIDGLKILLVEDDEDVLVATASLLRRWGCEVQPETSTPSTIGPCDILITDFDLGDRTTGSDCIRTVRAHNRDAAVIVITGHDAGRVKEDIDDPSIPILLKPLRPAELRSVIMAKAMATRTPAARFSPR